MIPRLYSDSVGFIIPPKNRFISLAIHLSAYRTQEYRFTGMHIHFLNPQNKYSTLHLLNDWEFLHPLCLTGSANIHQQIKPHFEMNIEAI